MDLLPIRVPIPVPNNKTGVFSVTGHKTMDMKVMTATTAVSLSATIITSNHLTVILAFNYAILPETM